ncbi:hypothetical protein KC332_g12926 [Hortaea werneckii]|nr:hypothetical protein KC358_g12873 [Hortaea werneckii]KAI6810272.1 hypothetical protein KC350_g12608 [Hortaea werneckii]KAI6911438.1 hypothetical protein KC348_g12961 [Hortaea werneckii]KAI6926701.1 hypothetical protein KC341_g12635 [Hortaea werneckii]KAI6960538.1 hypothetical protein KC321_g12803 [Hortaea werneckii]
MVRDGKLSIPMPQKDEMECNEVNMKKLATIGEYKTAASANTCWYNLKKKLFDTPNPTTTPSSSPSSSPSTKATPVNLTPSDLKLLNLIWQCLDGDAPKVDNKKLAQLGGYKTAASANTCWHNLRKKLFASQDGSAGADAGAGTGTASPGGKVRNTPTKKKGKGDGVGASSPAGKTEAPGGSMSGSGRKKRAVDCDDDATASAMDETPSKKLKGREAMIEEGSEALSTIAAVGSDANVKDAEDLAGGPDYILPKLEPTDDMEDVLTGEDGMGDKGTSEDVVKAEEEESAQTMPSEYADSATSTTAVAATAGEEHAEMDAGLRFFQQMREFAE